MNSRENASIKNVIDTITPLETGIVFGKDAAWNKLERKLDQQQKKPILLWWASGSMAACLIAAWLFIGYSDKNNSTTVSSLRPQQIANTYSKTTPDSTANELTILHTETTRHIKYKTNIPATIISTIVDTSITTQQAMLVSENKDTMPIVAAKKSMGIVHINDLENNTTALPYQSWASHSRINTMPMNIVHVNELVKPSIQEIEYILNKKEDNTSLVGINNPLKIYNSMYPNAGKGLLSITIK